MNKHRQLKRLALAVLLLTGLAQQAGAQEVDALQAYLDQIAEEQAAQPSRSPVRKKESVTIPVGLPEVDLSQFADYQARTKELTVKASVKFTNGTISATEGYAGGTCLLKVYGGATVVLDKTASVTASATTSTACKAAVGIYEGSTFCQSGSVTGTDDGTGTAIYLDTDKDTYSYVSGWITGTISNPNGGTLSGRDSASDYDWSVGAGGDFASINTAMSDSRVKDGDVLQVLKGTKISAAQNVTKAVTILGNGYKSQYDGYCPTLYIDQENVTVKSLYAGNIYIKNDNAVIERCRISNVSAVSDYGPEDITIRGCQIIFSISGDQSYYLSGWNISNNIIGGEPEILQLYKGYNFGLIPISRDMGVIRYLDGATIDHNIIVYTEKPQNITGSRLTRAAYNPFPLTEPSFTNNIIIEDPFYSSEFTGNILSSVAAEATKMEYNIHSDTSNPDNWPTNKAGYGDSDDVLFACTGGRADTYYQLAENSPAKGYANDGGDCGPWSGSFPYIQYGIDTTNPGGGDNPGPGGDEWQVEPNDLLALKNIYQAFGGDNWTTKWSFANNGHKKEDFPGVTITDEGRVTAINLENNGLVGECFLVSSPQLSELTTLNMKRNQITGDLGLLVNELANLKNLDVSYNRLTTLDGKTAFAEGFSSTINTRYQNREYTTSSPTTAGFTANVATMEAPVYTIGAKMDLTLPTLYTYNFKSQDHNLSPTLHVRKLTSPASVFATLNSHGSGYGFSFSGVYSEQQDLRVAAVDEVGGYDRYSAYAVILRYVEGDADMTGVTNVQDVQYTLNYILAPTTLSYFNYSAANTYADDKVNVQDIVQTVNIILDRPRTPDYLTPSARGLEDEEETAADGYVYTRQGRIMIEADKAVSAIDIDLEGVGTDEVALLLNQRDYQMIGCDTEWGSRYVIFSPTGKSIPVGEATAVLRLAGAGTPVAVECADPQAQPVMLAVGITPTGISETVRKDDADSERYYNLGGQRVIQPSKGIYINGGRKMIVK